VEQIQEVRKMTCD